jgi:hypothetical protein
MGRGWDARENALLDIVYKLFLFHMDIFSHGLWAMAAAKALNNRRFTEKPLSLLQAGWWGVFPDLFAFGAPFVVMIALMLTGQIDASTMRRPPQMEPANPQLAALFALAPQLYQLSHSLVVFAVVVLLVRVLFKKWPWILLGWLLHILADIPTHTYKFYPTPIFWPISHFTVSGFPWSQWWFLALDYSLLVMTFVYLFRGQGSKRLFREKVDDLGKGV